MGPVCREEGDALSSSVTPWQACVGSLAAGLLCARPAIPGGCTDWYQPRSPTRRQGADVGPGCGTSSLIPSFPPCASDPHPSLLGSSPEERALLSAEVGGRSLGLSGRQHPPPPLHVTSQGSRNWPGGCRPGLQVLLLLLCSPLSAPCFSVSFCFLSLSRCSTPSPNSPPPGGLISLPRGLYLTLPSGSPVSPPQPP